MADLKSGKTLEKGKTDLIVTIVPMAVVAGLAVLFFFLPVQSNDVTGAVRSFFGDTLGAYYIVIGIAVFLVSLYLCGSKYGGIVLGGRGEKPRYSFFSWGAMMFTCGLAADILFYSFAEWVMYASEPRIAELGSVQEWAEVFPLFHWSFIPWAFYLVLAAAFGFMLHVRGRDRQRYSEACRPILGKHADGLAGRIIDLLAVFALIAGTATTFSVATPLMAEIISDLTGIEADRRFTTIVILLLTCAVYTYAVLHGLKGISVLAKVCIWLFFGLLLFVLLTGGHTGYIIETGIESFGRMVQNFIGLASYTDPLRTSSFPQNWTIYYWAYWMVWCVAAPFFIGSISRGRTVRQVIAGGYVFGVGSTLVSFIVLGGQTMGMQLKDGEDFVSLYTENGDIYSVITAMIERMPASGAVMTVLLLTMIAFYATSFDSIAMTAASYSCRRLGADEAPPKPLRFLWCILLIVLPAALVFAESSMNCLQSVSIIAAFPIGIVMILIVISFFKDAKQECGREEKKE